MNGFWGTRKLADEAARLGRSVTQEHLQNLCRNGTISGAQKPARDWLIPEEEARRWLKSWLARKEQHSE